LSKRNILIADDLTLTMTSLTFCILPPTPPMYWYSPPLLLCQTS